MRSSLQSGFMPETYDGCYRYGATGLRTKTGGGEHVSSVRGEASLVLRRSHERYRTKGAAGRYHAGRPSNRRFRRN